MSAFKYARMFRGKELAQQSEGKLMEFTANNMWDNPGARRFPKQVGRGPGSGKG